MANKNLVQSFNRLWYHFSPHRRAQFGLLLILMIFASFAEIFTIGAVLPFLAVITAPERVFNHKEVQPVIEALGLTAPQQLLLPLTIAFGVAALIAGGLRLLLLWSSTRLAFATGADLSIDIYRRTLYQSYEVHCARNSSEIINGISGKTNTVIYSIILPALTLITSTVILISILLTLMALDPAIALQAFCGFGFIYILIIRFTRRRLLANSQCIARESSNVIKLLQEGLGGIRDILIDGSQHTYCQIYRNADLALRHAQGSNSFISSSPRFLIEAIGMVLVAILTYWYTVQVDGFSKAIPILGTLALGAQRLLPLLQQAYAALSDIRGGQSSLSDILELLDQSSNINDGNPSVHPLTFQNSISLKQVGFRYSPQSPYVIKRLDLVITKGSRIGFIGSTGSGKSTLLDIIMGLLKPTDGTLLVDGQVISSRNNREWQMHIAHVPQFIFLADSSIEENIAFGVPKDQIDLERVRKAARQAQIAEIIETWPKQYNTFVGERGIRLSGGQRQRIGIARALYKQADVIIFDEATSALDQETEHAVMQAIEGLSQDLTLLIIAHRLSTLKNCTQIVELGEGGIKCCGSYEDIVQKSE